MCKLTNAVCNYVAYRNDAVEERYMVFLKMDSQANADDFYRYFNGKEFSSLEVNTTFLPKKTRKNPKTPKYYSNNTKPCPLPWLFSEWELVSRTSSFPNAPTSNAFGSFDVADVIDDISADISADISNDISDDISRDGSADTVIDVLIEVSVCVVLCWHHHWRHPLCVCSLMCSALLCLCPTFNSRTRRRRRPRHRTDSLSCPHAHSV